MDDELSDEEYARQYEQRARWWFTFTGTVRVRAESEADARQAIAENALVHETDARYAAPWGPFVAIGDLEQQREIAPE